LKDTSQGTDQILEIRELKKKLDNLETRLNDAESIREAITMFLENAIDENKRSTDLLAEKILPALKTTYEKIENLSDAFDS